MAHTDRPGESKVAKVTLDLKVLASRETPEAIYINHPKNILKFLFLPKSEISKIATSSKGGVWREVTMSEWIAEEKNLI